MAESVVAELNLGNYCSLTLTTKHLRGQFYRVVREDKSQKRTTRDQIDVLLNGVAGYSIEHIDKKAKRISWICGGVLIFILFLIAAAEGTFFAGLLIGGVVGFAGWKFNPDKYAFAVNVMGAQSLIPIKVVDLPVVQEFITKLQNAKIAYDEANG